MNRIQRAIPRFLLAFIALILAIMSATNKVPSTAIHVGGFQFFGLGGSSNSGWSSSGNSDSGWSSGGSNSGSWDSGGGGGWDSGGDSGSWDSGGGDGGDSGSW